MRRCSRMLLVLCIESLYRNDMPLPPPLIWEELGVLTALERHPLVTITVCPSRTARFSKKTKTASTQFIWSSRGTVNIFSISTSHAMSGMCLHKQGSLCFIWQHPILQRRKMRLKKGMSLFPVSGRVRSPSWISLRLEESSSLWPLGLLEGSKE